MKIVSVAVIAGALSFGVDTLQARPPFLDLTERTVAAADTIAIIRPKQSLYSPEKPDSASFPLGKSLNDYWPLETECDVIATLKGTIDGPSLRLRHFVYKHPWPEFDGGMFMSFLFRSNLIVDCVTFPRESDGRADTSRQIPYAQSFGEYLAFLRKLPDGRFAPAAPQFDSAGAFRLLSVPDGAQKYFSTHCDVQKQSGAKGTEPPRPVEPSSAAAPEGR